MSTFANKTNDDGADLFRADRPERAANPDVSLSGKRILVVDDNEINLDIATEALLSAGATVDNAPDGKQALQLVAQTKYDLVLLDLSMPGISGLAVGRGIRASKSNSDTKVLLFTATDNADATKAARELNAQGWVAKPVDIDDLLRKVARFA